MKPSEQLPADYDHDLESDPVWKLIETAKETEVGPFFSRNVMREIRHEAETPASWWNQLASVFRQPVIVVPAAAAIALAAVMFVAGDRSSTEMVLAPTDTIADEVGEVSSFDPTEEVEALSSFGELMAVADPAQLSDAAIADLLF